MGSRRPTGDQIGSTTSPRGLGEVIVSSRPYDEYLAMFGLKESEVIAGEVLDCPAGAGSFGVAVRAVWRVSRGAC